MKKVISLLIMLVLLCNSALSWGQTEPEEIKLEDNKFKEYFFEALKQKAIEFYGIQNFQAAVMGYCRRIFGRQK